MPLPTGTATPWRQIEDPSVEEGSSVYTYIRPGEKPGPSELLAEQIRMDGIVYSLGPALRTAEGVQAELSWYGLHDDTDEETLCDEDGWTHDGSRVVEPLRCVLARVDSGD